MNVESIRGQWRNSQYLENRREALRRRYLTGVPALAMKAAPKGANIKAAAGDVEPLIDYLLSDAPLSANDRQALAWLIWLYRCALPRGRGTPARHRGSVEKLNVALAVMQKRAWCERQGRARYPKGESAKLIEHAINERFPKVNEKSKYDLEHEIEILTRRGKHVLRRWLREMTGDAP